jgi:PAS domain S-box-containing protein
MTDLDIGTVLASVAGVMVFLAVVMALSWGTQRVHPGFGLWTASTVLMAVAALVLADRGHFPTPVLTIVVPTILVLAAVVRLEAARRFLGRRHFDSRVLALPVVVATLCAVFTYARTDVFVRALVTTGATALAYWAIAVFVTVQGREEQRRFLRVCGTTAALFGALVVGYGISWLVRSQGHPLEEMGPANFLLFMLVMLFEIGWTVICLTLNSRLAAAEMAAAHGVTESERRRLADFVAFLPDATFAVDAERRVVAWNRMAEEMSGIAAKDVLGKPFDASRLAALGATGARQEMLLDAVLDPSRKIPDRYRNVRRDGDRISAEEEIDVPDRPGQPMHLWYSAAPIRNAEGVVTGAVETMRDVTWRMGVERAIRESEERYRSLFEHNLDGILVIAPDGTILDANPAACKMLGRTKEEVCATEPGDLIRPDPDVEERLRAHPPLGVDIQEFTYMRKDGTSFPAENVSVAWKDAADQIRAFVQFRDISERLEAQRILRESEARLLQAQAVAHLGNWEIDLVARSVWMSPEALRIYGVEGTSSYFALDPKELSRLAVDPAPVAAALERAMSEGGSYDVEYRIRRMNDGVVRTVHAMGEASCDASGRPVKVAGVVQDVTELRQVEEALELTQFSVDHAGDQTFWMTPEGKFAFVSDAMCEQLGYTREELQNMTLYDIDPTLTLDWGEAWDRVKRERTVVYEGVHRTKDGRDIPVESSATYLIHNGQEYNFVYARDISKRRQMEEKLRQTQLSVDRANDLVFWVNSEGRFVFVSDCTCRQLGYTREELLDMTIYDIDPTLSKDWRRNWDRVRQRGSVTHEAVHRTKDGRDIPVEISSNYIEHDGEEYDLVFARDISARRQEEEVLAKTESQLRQSLKMEAVGQLAGGIAHDFNNLLTAIIGYGNLILASDEAKELTALRKDVEEIRAAAERAASLTNQISAFARHQTLRPQVLSLGALVDGMKEGLQSLLGGRIQLELIQGPGTGYVEVDKERFEQVVTNLASNARDAMPGGGRLTIETRDISLTEEYCRVYPELQPGDYVLLSVSDTGVGMSPQTTQRIFEPFFTTKRPGEGAGLGLSMVYGIVKQSGGQVLVYSEVNRGTTFKIYLPQVAGPARGPGATPAALPLRGGHETVLVVEDEAPLRRLVARVLGDLGYRVVVAGSGPEALELLEEMESPPDLLLTDVILPGGMQGNELARVFLDALPHLPVLYMSGHPKDAIVHSGRLDEGVEFLAKPFAPETLGVKVRQVLDSHARGLRRN